MDDTPKGFVQELRTSILRKRVGQIALAVVLAEAVWHLVSSVNWLLIVPIIGKLLQGHTESVLFEGASKYPIAWDRLFGSLLEFILTVIVVFYLNHWIHGTLRHVVEEPGKDELEDVT